MNKRNRCDNAFKAQAVKLALEIGQNKACNALNLPENTLYNRLHATVCEALMPQIHAGIAAKEQYCKTVSNAFINEAQTGNRARLNDDSPLLRKT